MAEDEKGARWVYLAGASLVFEAVGLVFRPHGSALLVYLWLAAPVSLILVGAAVLLTNWNSLKPYQYRSKALVWILLYCGLATSFAFVYSLVYMYDDTAFTISSDISLKQLRKEEERAIAEFASTRRIAFVTAVSMVRNPNAENYFLEASLVSETVPRYRPYLTAVGHHQDKDQIIAGLDTLSFLEKFTLAESIKSRFSVPDFTDAQVADNVKLLREGLEHLRDGDSGWPGLRELGFLESVEPKVRTVFQQSKDPMTLRILRNAGENGLRVLDAAEARLGNYKQELLQAVVPKSRTWETQLHFLYFSFVCLSTIGFGDIAPNAWVARTALVAEVLFGIYIVSILLTALLGQSLADSGAPKRSAK